MTGISTTARDLSPWLVVAGLAAALLSMLALLGALRGRMHAEVSRKVAHVGLGVALVALPWLLLDIVHVVALVLMALGVMLAIRLVPALRARYGGVVHGVRRSGHGDLYFPVAAAARFVLAQDDRLLYAGPLRTRTVADAGSSPTSTVARPGGS